MPKLTTMVSAFRSGFAGRLSRSAATVLRASEALGLSRLGPTVGDWTGVQSVRSDLSPRRHIALNRRSQRRLWRTLLTPSGSNANDLERFLDHSLASSAALRLSDVGWVWCRSSPVLLSIT